MREPRGWYSRGYLPHIDAGDVPQFITWRLADALPASVLEAWERELDKFTEPDRVREMAKRVEVYCDQGHGACYLKDPRVARLVQETMFRGHGTSYELHAWTVMPNHVHVLVSPMGMSLENLVKTLKGASSFAINCLLGRQGRLWQPGFFDRFIRDSDHMAGVQRYIEWNPVKARLCTDPARWPWSSASKDARARLDFLIDTMAIGAGRLPDQEPEP
jgi:REP element-mobilizing transposase RayT